MANTEETVERHYPVGDDGADPPYLHPDYGSTVKRSPANPRNNFLSGLKVRDEGARTC